jgi:hypothetical protein
MTDKNKQSLPNHTLLFFKERDNSFYEIKLKHLDDKNLEYSIRTLLNEILEYEKITNDRIWLLHTKDLKTFLESINDLEKDYYYRLNNPSSSEDDSDSDSTTDDELIQKALARRMKSEPSNIVIDNDNISDSEMEDVLSLSRRFRYILNRLDNIEKKLNIAS